MGPVAAVGVALLAAPHAQAQSGTTTVLGTANIYASGGNTPSAPGGGGAGTSPTLIDLTAGTSRQLSFGSITGTWGCGPASNGPDGASCAGPSTNINASGSLGGIQTGSRNMFLVGVFLGPSLPAAPPATLAYSTASLSSATFGPFLPGQVFFIGDGLTGTGAGFNQVFFVPDAATRLYLGVADAFAFGSDVAGGRPPGFYDDNSGSVSVTYAIRSTALATPEPSSLALMVGGLSLLTGWSVRRRKTR